MFSWVHSHSCSVVVSWQCFSSGIPRRGSWVASRFRGELMEYLNSFVALLPNYALVCVGWHSIVPFVEVLEHFSSANSFIYNFVWRKLIAAWSSVAEMIHYCNEGLKDAIWFIFIIFARQSSASCMLDVPSAQWTKCFITNHRLAYAESAWLYFCF